MMDTKKFMKKVGFFEKILSPKRRNVVSGFGLGVGILLLVFSLISLNNSLNASFFNPILFQGSNCMSISPSSLELHLVGNFVSEKTHQGNLSEKDKDSSFLVSNGGKKLVTEETHEEKSRDINRSFHSDEEGIIIIMGNKSHQGNLSAEVNNSRFSKKEEAIFMKTHGGNLSKNSSFLVSNGGKGVTDETHEENFKEKNGSFHSEGKSIEIHEENLLEKDKVAFSSIDSREMNRNRNRIGNHSKKCDIFDGRWVRDGDKTPYYPAGSCPHIDTDFDCHLNGRRDDEFLRWQWQPNECHIPSLNATDFLERMRGKRLLFVGDSLNRNMWESLVCILRHSGVPDTWNELLYASLLMTGIGSWRN